MCGGNPREKKKIEMPAKSPLLAFQEFRKSLAIETDASKKGLGTSLMQFDDKKLDRVASPETSEAEFNCSITKRETMAVIWSMRHCSELIWGYATKFINDHGPCCRTPRRKRTCKTEPLN